MPEKLTGPIAAAVVDGKTTVFYVNSNKFLFSLVNEEDGDQEIVQTDKQARSNYTGKPLRVNGKDVTSATKDIAAISYKPPKDGCTAPTKTSIYYIRLHEQDRIDQNNSQKNGCQKNGYPQDPKGGYLAELCKNEGSWFHGKLNDNFFPAVPGSPITAAWNSATNSVKVIYYLPDKDKIAPYVAWVDEKGSWQKGWIQSDQ